MDSGIPHRDGSRQRILVLTLVLSLFALTIPRMIINYGADGDVFRNVAGAECLATTGHYDPVRLPGSPLFDYMLAALAPWGHHFATNGAVLLFYLAGVALFCFATRDRPGRLMLTALFAFTPILVKNAVTTMDYIPGLTLLLASYVALLRNRILLAALLLGLAAGMRVTNLVFIAPAALLFRRGDRPIRDIAIYWSVASSTTLGFHWRFVSSLATGTFALAPKSFLRWLQTMGHNAMELWGPVALVALPGIILLHRARLRRLLRDAASNPNASDILVELSTILLFGFAFLILPDAPEYLLPIVPFTYLLLARFVPRPYMRFLTIVILLAGIVSLDMKGGESGRRTVQFRPAAGIVLGDYMQRHEWEMLREGLSAIPAPGRAVVLAGTDYPLFYANPAVEYASLDDYPVLRHALHYRQEDPTVHRLSDRIWKLKDREVFFVTSLPRHIGEDLQRKGFKLFIFSLMAPSYAIHIHGYDPDDLGIEELAILTEGAFYRNRVQ